MDYNDNAAESSFDSPQYYSSIPSPNYSYELATGERMLECTPQQSSFPRPSGLYIKKEGGITVVLDNQEDGTHMPTYGRRAIISGHLCFKKSDSILEVAVKIQGTMDIVVSEVGGKTITMFEVSCLLWSQTSSEPQSSTCPSQIAFSTAIPATFKAGEDLILPLPPTYASPHLCMAGPYAKISYTLQVTVKRSRHPKVGVWTKIRQISIPLNYAPRTRAHRPIVRFSSFLTSIKSAPEEWHQAVAPLSNKNSDIKFHTIIFVPRHRVFGLLDKIPFHLQLIGDVQALQELFPCVHGQVRLPSSSKSQTIVTSPSIVDSDVIRIEIILLRQISVSFKGTRSWEETIIGRGNLSPTPPDVISKRESMCHIDWDGEVRCNETVTVGGFDAANIHVKDFIVLKIVPVAYKCPVRAEQIAIPIRLVTDSFDSAGLYLNDIATHN